MEGLSFFHRAPLIYLFRFPVRRGLAILLTPILVRLAVLLRRSAYDLLLYRTSSDEKAYSASLEKRHFTAGMCKASAWEARRTAYLDATHYNPIFRVLPKPNPPGQKTRPGRWHEQELIPLRTLMIN